MRRILLSFAFLFCLSMMAIAQHDGHNHGHDHGHDHSGHDHAQHDNHAGHNHADHGQDAHGDDHGHHGCSCHHEVNAANFDPGQIAFHHISDQNIYNIGPFHFGLPVIAYATDGTGLSFFSSGYFDADAHGSSCKAKDKYMLVDGMLRRVPGLPMGEIETEGFYFDKNNDLRVCYGGKELAGEDKSTADGGLFGGGITSFYDFSITKNILTMIIVCLLLGWMFISIARKYKEREGQAPSGLQGVIEPVFLFIQEEVAKPFLGHKYMKYQPFLMALFFFILGLNLFGQVPFFGNPNVTGSLAVTMVLAIITALVVNFNGNKHYWEHTLWMPGVPPLLKVLILTPVEILGLFIKPLTLMLRLFANITAGHLVLTIFVGLIFLFGQVGMNPAASYGTAIGSGLLSVFMMSIELLVAFIQAFVFTILTASYVGAAVEEAHH